MAKGQKKKKKKKKKMFHRTWIVDGADGDSENVTSTARQWYPLQPGNLYDIVFAPPHADEESRLRVWKTKNNGVRVLIREHKKTTTDHDQVSVSFSPQRGRWVLLTKSRKRTAITRTKIRLRPRVNGEREPTTSNALTNPAQFIAWALFSKKR